MGHFFFENFEHNTTAVLSRDLERSPMVVYYPDDHDLESRVLDDSDCVVTQNAGKPFGLP